MKVAFAVDFLRPTGIVRVVRNIALELAQHADISVSIICTGIDKDFTDYIPEHIAVYNLNIDRYGRYERYLRYVGAIRKLFLTDAPDVLVVSGMEHILFYTAASRTLKKMKKIAWEHRNFKAGPKFRLEWIGKRLALKKWDGIVCITKKDYQYYQNYACDLSKLHQIYNLVTFSAERKPYDVQSSKIISCGYLDPVKGFDILMKVAGKLLQKRSDWIWDIYGEGDEWENLEKLIAEYGLEEHVFLKGYCADINERYSEYSMFVMTSRSEGMGMVLIEAQKAGLPAVAFDIDCGPSDVIVEGENGYLIPTFDADKMAEMISKLIEDRETRKRFSEQSEMRQTEFEKDAILKKWKEILEFPG